MARRILAGEPVPEISPLTKTLVSITKRGRSVLLSTPAFSDRFHSLRYCALDLCSSDASVGRLRFIDRLPGINAHEGPADDQRLRENPADGSSLIEGFFSLFCVDAGGNPDVNLTIECSRHAIASMSVPLYHGTSRDRQTSCDSRFRIGESILRNTHLCVRPIHLPQRLPTFTYSR